MPARLPKTIKRLLGHGLGMSDALKNAVGFGPAETCVHPATAASAIRGPVTHVVILDGTMSTLKEGHETNAGRTFRLLSEMAPSKAISLKYEAGIQWRGVRRAIDVMAGVGINDQIRSAYGFIASRYRPGDRIFLFGYSRGAYAVRSLAGVIDLIGLVKADCATERKVRQAYRHYRMDPGSSAAAAFRKVHCHPSAPIEMVGVWDTVRALGFRAPVLWRFSPEEHAFHSTHLGKTVRHGYHALALNETRNAFSPVLWQSEAEHEGTLQQVWFAGSHGDIGGQLSGFEAARPLSNLPLIWMLENASRCGLPLPDGWQTRYPVDVDAPSVGTFANWGKLFLQRSTREVGLDPSETVHPSAASRRAGWAYKLPWVARPDVERLRS